MNKNKVIVSCSLFLGMFLGFSSTLSQAQSQVDPLANPPTPAFAGQTGAPKPKAQSDFFKVDLILSDLQGPRSLVVLPDGKLLVVEGAGRALIINEDGSVSAPIAGMPPIRSVNGRSLGDFIIDKNFAENRRVFLSYNAPPSGEAGGPKTVDESRAAAAAGKVFQVPKIATATLSQDYSRLENVKEIADIPGRRLVSTADGKLFITTVGALDNRPQVQDLSSYLGKVLRINADGSIPKDNPFVGNKEAKAEIFAIGHRDPDGAFIHPQTGELWTIEHGPMGGDELNVVRAGQNSGWPVNTYGKNYDGTEIGPSNGGAGMTQPLYYWFPSVAPSSLMMYTGNVFPQWSGNVFLGTMSPTQGKFIARLKMDGEKVVEEEHLLVGHDRRVRALAQGRDGAIYVLTDSENNNQTNRHFAGEVLKLSPK